MYSKAIQLYYICVYVCVYRHIHIHIYFFQVLNVCVSSP